jgi:hypothetical protein
MGVDAFGGPVIDPTRNVLDKVEDSVARLDDLRAMSDKLADEKIKRLESEQKHLWNLHTADARRIDEQAALRAAHSETIHRMERAHYESLRHAESDRLDAIRQVDREDVSKTAAQVLNSVQTLASTAASAAETLRNQRSQDQTEINKRVSAVELALSEGKGKQIATDPTMDRLVANMERLILAQSAAAGASKVTDPALEKMADAIAGLTAFQASTTGRKEGISAAMALAMSIGTLLIGALGMLGISFVMKAAGGQ